MDVKWTFIIIFENFWNEKRKSEKQAKAAKRAKRPKLAIYWEAYHLSVCFLNTNEKSMKIFTILCASKSN
jgi:hypothetical protein